MEIKRNASICHRILHSIDNQPRNLAVLKLSLGSCKMQPAVCPISHCDRDQALLRLSVAVVVLLNNKIRYRC